MGQVSAGFALCILGDVVGQLGQGLGGRDAHAGGYADAALYAAADGVGAAGDVWHAVQADKAFVDAVDLLLRAHAGGQAHHAVAHVAVEGEIGAQRDQAVGGVHVLHLEVGLAHLDADGLGFFAACDDAAVVVAQDDQRHTLERGAEHTLARCVEVVAVQQGEHAITSGLAKTFDAAGDHAPDFQGLAWLGPNVGVGGVFWMQDQLVVAHVQALAGELAVQLRHHDVPVLGAQVLVDHQQVAVEHARAFHAVALQPQDEGALGVEDQFLGQVDALGGKVLCRAGEAPAHFGTCQWERHGVSVRGHRVACKEVMTVHAYSIWRHKPDCLRL